MVKTKGSKDKIRNRKTRTDKGKKREKYAGKKTNPRRKVNGKFVPYISKRKRGDLIKVWFWDVKKMRPESLMNFSKSSRRKMHRYVYGRNRVRIDVLPENLSTKERISELCLEYLWEGEWLLKLWSHARNKYKCTARAFARIVITDHPEGLKCRIIPNYKRRSLKRMFFWREL